MKTKSFLPVILGGVVVACSGPAVLDADARAEVRLGATAVAVAPAKGPGMGAILQPGGARFRVWAPFAKQVFVAGDFNAWSDASLELASEGNGHWSRDVAGVQAGQKYKYVIVGRDGRRAWKTDPRAQRVENSVGAGVVHDPAAYTWRSSFATPPWNEQVIYEMHIGTFNDAPGGGPGTWRSAAEKLDHVRDLGANMVEVLPVAEFPGDFSWGYNPAFPFAPESAYGTPEDMKYFVDQAHARGIGVILDVVYNHFGPDDLAMWCFDGECLGKGGAYFYTDGRASTPWGAPRPDYGRSEVRDYIRDNVSQWLDEYRLDGLRWDATKFIRTVNGDGQTHLAEGYGMLQWINDDVHRRAPWKIQIAEDFGLGHAVSQPTGHGGLGFDSQWDGGFVHPIRDAVIPPSDGDRSMWGVRRAVTSLYNGQATHRVIYTESHDECANGKQRVPEMIHPGKADSWYAQKRSTLAAAVLFTSPGIPMLFQGQEWLEAGWFKDTVPIDWAKATTFAGIRGLYTDLAHLRRNWHDNTRGLRGDHVNVFHVNDATKVIAYHRWQMGGPGDDVVVVANFSTQTFGSYTVGMPRGGMWRVRFNSDAKGYSASFGNAASYDTLAEGGGTDGMPYRANVGIGPYTAIVLSQ